MLLALVVIAAVGRQDISVVAQDGGQRMPTFEVDTSWPKLPNNWVTGIVSSVTVDRRDHVWVLHRPRSVPDNLKAQAAPPVLEFDPAGKFLNAWGGAAPGYDWPLTEHGITVDYKDVVWIGGSGVGDDMYLKFTTQGKFLKQFGAKGQSKGNADQVNVNRAADVYVYQKTNEAFIADGYGNRRVIVLDAETGAFKRMWGGFGKTPDTAPPSVSAGGPPAPPQLDTEGPGSQEFSNPVHAVKISNDDPVPRGTRLWRNDEGEWRDLGVITSWAYSFVLDTGLALAYVKRRHQKAGTEFRVGEGPTSAVIVPLPVRAQSVAITGEFE